MKPASFRYFAPTTVDEVVSLLREHGDEAKVLAGGQSLVPLMNFRLAAPTVLVDVNRVSGLDRIGVSDTVVLGATARQLAVEDSAEVATAAPVLGQALRHVGHVAIRSRGTIGGSIAHADPAAELPAVLVALDGEVRVRSTAGERCVAARDLYKGLFETSLSPEELITGVLFPMLGGGSAVCEVARRQGDFALAGAVALVATDGLDTITEARIVLFSVGPTPVRAASSEEFLRGRKASDRAVLSEAARLAAERLEPLGDVQVPASYKKSVAATVTRRALADAVARERAMSELVEVTAVVNGTPRSGRAEPRTLLVDFLRHELSLTGTHVGCEQGVCGACTVRVDGDLARACLLFAVQVDGSRVDTVEGMAQGSELHPIQEAFRAEHGLQCGFCTPGLLLSVECLLERNIDPSEEEVREFLSGNVCRCTGYNGIVAATLLAARMRQNEIGRGDSDHREHGLDDLSTR